MKKRILVIHSTLEAGGLTRIIYLIAAGLGGQDFQWKIITLSPEPENSEWSRFVDAGIEVTSLGEKSRYSMFSMISKLRKEVNAYQPQLIHTHGLRGTLLTALLFKNIPQIATIHGDLKKNYQSQYGKWKGLLMAKLEYWASNRAFELVLVSPHLRNCYPWTTSVQVIRNGIALDGFYKASVEEKLRLREKAGLSSANRIFVSVGAFHPLKNIAGIITAFREAAKPTDTLLLLNDGVERESLHRLAAGDARIVFIGAVKNVAHYLQMSDVMISASFSEGMPNAVMEAMACGLQLLLSDIPAHHVFLDINRFPNHYFDPMKVETLSACIASLNEALEEIPAQQFSYLDMAAAYGKLYHQNTGFSS